MERNKNGQFKKGSTPYNKGMKMPETSKRLTGSKLSEETKKKNKHHKKRAVKRGTRAYQELGVKNKTIRFLQVENTLIGRAV